VVTTTQFTGTNSYGQAFTDKVCALHFSLLYSC
jgi:hypothetical protein